MAKSRSWRSTERDKRLCELMEVDYIDLDGDDLDQFTEKYLKQDFDHLEGFIELLEWAKEQEWFEDFMETYGMVATEKSTFGEPLKTFYLDIDMILRFNDFGDKILEFLDEQEEEAGEETSEENKLMICDSAFYLACKKCEHGKPHEAIEACTGDYECQFVKGVNACCVPYNGQKPERLLETPSESTKLMKCKMAFTCNTNVFCIHRSIHEENGQCFKDSYCSVLKAKTTCVPVTEADQVAEKEVWST